MLGGIGGFAGLFALKLGRYTEPVLAASTDGVGTKVAIAQALDKHDTIGLDLVAMVVDDLVVCGAEPLFLQDYIAVGKLVPEHVAAVVAGIAEGCQRAGCALLGGETAEHPGMMEAGGYDLSATGVGIVEADAMLRPAHVRPGDVLIGMGSSGLHSNGYSLARHVLLRIARMPLEGHVEELGRTLGEELLVPTTIYARDCLALVAETNIHTFAHITGGGLARNLARVLPDGLGAVVERGSWTPQPVFRLIAVAGPRRAGGDGADVQHGRRDGGRAARRRRRPRAGRAHRPARARVGARARSSAARASSSKATTPASDPDSSPRRTRWDRCASHRRGRGLGSGDRLLTRPRRPAGDPPGQRARQQPWIRRERADLGEHAEVVAHRRVAHDLVAPQPVQVELPYGERPAGRRQHLGEPPSSKTVNGPVCLPLRVISESTWCSSAKRCARRTAAR